MKYLIMKYLFFVLLTVDLITVFHYSGINSYVIPRRRNFMPTSWGNIIDDYLTYDSDEGHDIEILGCEGKGCSNSADNEVNNLVDVDCSTGYGENEMPNELPLIGQPSEHGKDIHNFSEIATTTPNDLYIGSLEMSDLLDTLSDILHMKKNLESAHSINIFQDDIHNFGDNSEFLELSDQEDPTVLVVGFENSDNSVNSKEDTVMDGVLLADLFEEERFHDTSNEWLEDPDETLKVVENGYIYYDMESRE